MQRRGALKEGNVNDSNLNKFLSAPPNKNSDMKQTRSGKSELIPSAQLPIKDRNLENSYAFKIRFPDKERNVYFAKEEVNKLATEIGIDMEHDKESHIWFLQQALLSELPLGWQKEQDLAGNAVYHNSYTNETSSLHPNIYKFRLAFNNILKAEASKQTIANEGMKSLTKGETILLQTQIKKLPESEQISLVKKIKDILARGGEKAKEEIAKQLIGCI